jgi:hypothetical protein
MSCSVHFMGNAVAAAATGTKEVHTHSQREKKALPKRKRAAFFQLFRAAERSACRFRGDFNDGIAN